MFNDTLRSATGYYTQLDTAKSGCDSITVLHLIVNTPVHVAVTIDTCDWYQWNGTTYTSTGNYTYSHTDANGCTQVDTLHLTIRHATNLAVTVDTCDWYQWNGNTYTATGDYTYSHTDVNGCTQVDTLHLTIYHATNLAVTVDTCDLYQWHGTAYTSTGTYIYSFADANGCTQVDTLHLTLHSSYNLSVKDTICQNELSWSWRDTIFGTGTVSGDYVFHRHSVNGCDSIVTLHLVVHPSYSLSVKDTICQNELPWSWRDTTFGVGTVSGDYVFNRQTVNGCDSIVTLHLTVNPYYNISVNDEICAKELPWTWRDTIFNVGTVSGDYVFNRQTVNGCDSIVTLHLVVSSTYNISITDTICQNALPWTWRDTIFDVGTVSGDYVFNRQTVNGCDSIVTLHLTVNTVLAVAVKDTICKDALPYHWRDTIFQVGTVSGDYVFHRTSIYGCDSIVTLTLTINEITVTVLSSTDEICGNDGKITLSATGTEPLQYSLDGITFQSSATFTGLADGSYTITVVDANTCKATTTATIQPAVVPMLSITCPPDVHDTTNFGECMMKLSSEVLGTPTATHSLGWPYVITNNAPSDSLYYEGDQTVTWVMTDTVCGYKDSCQQHVYIAFPPCPDAVDAEGNVYHSVRIDCDCWTQRNLESTMYSDSTDISGVYNYVCEMYPDIATNVSIFGRLYSYSAAIRDSSENGHGHIQGVCPAGWYLPTSEQFLNLNAYGADALKSSLYWIPSGGNNSTGFSALPAGYYNGINFRYENLLIEACFWSIQVVGPPIIMSSCHIYMGCETVIELPVYNSRGYSVRCVKEKE